MFEESSNHGCLPSSFYLWEGNHKETVSLDLALNCWNGILQQWRLLRVGFHKLLMYGSIFQEVCPIELWLQLSMRGSVFLQWPSIYYDWLNFRLIISASSCPPSVVPFFTFSSIAFQNVQLQFTSPLLVSPPFPTPFDCYCQSNPPQHYPPIPCHLVPHPFS